MNNFKEILDTYWPIIEAAQKVRIHYAAKIAPDVCGDLIKALNKAEKELPVQRVEI